MTHIRLVIDHTAAMDGDLGQWTAEPPAITDLKLKAGNEPWAIPAMQAIAHAAIRQQDTAITVNTHTSGWSITVDHDVDLTPP